MLIIKMSSSLNFNPGNLIIIMLAGASKINNPVDPSWKMD
jgi:hypothetical protein